MFREFSSIWEIQVQKCQDGPLADGWGEVSHWSAERNEGELQVHLIAVLPRLSGSSLRG